MAQIDIDLKKMEEAAKAKSKQKVVDQKFKEAKDQKAKEEMIASEKPLIFRPEEDAKPETAQEFIARNALGPSEDVAIREVEAQQEAEVIEEISTPVNVPANMKDSLEKKTVDPVNSIKQSVSNQQTRNAGEEPKVADSFMEALTFFLPTAIGGLVGGMAGGGDEGAVAGAEAGTSLGAAFRDFKMKQAELEKKEEMTPYQQAQLELGKGNLAARLQEIQTQKEGAKDREEFRKLRFEEKDLGRAMRLKEKFVTQKDVSKLKEQQDELQSIENLALEGKKIPGALASKVARAIAGEVGVLTNQDIARSQVNPDLYSSLIRGASRIIKGELSERDSREMLKIVKALKTQSNTNMRKKIKRFSKSRAKDIQTENIRNTFEQDLVNEHIGSEEPSSPGLGINQDALNAELKRRGLL